MENIFDIQERKNYSELYEDSSIDRAYTENNGDKIKMIKSTIKIGCEFGKRAAQIIFDGSLTFDPLDFPESFSNVDRENLTVAVSNFESYRDLLIRKKDEGVRKI